MKRNWYNLKAAANGKAAQLSIYDDIGMWGVSAQAFIRDLATVGGGELDLEISSLGGSVFEGVAIYNALKRYAEKPGNSITVRVMGVAASIASYIAMAGTKIVMPANTYLMVHKPWGGVAGNADEMRDYADLLDKIENSILGAYMGRSGKSEDEMKDMLSKDTWMTAQEAVDAGFADEVVDAVEVSASYEAERLPENLRALFAEAYLGDEVDDADDSSVKPGDETPPVDQVKPFAAEANALLIEADLEDHAAGIVLACTSIDEVKARVAVASEINALCAVAKRPDDAKALIGGNKTVAQARAHLVEALAKQDDDVEIDSTPKTSTSPTNGAQPSGVNTAAIWAARRNSGAKK